MKYQYKSDDDFTEISIFYFQYKPHMTNRPILSVVMPIFNGEKYLETAINSILTQTFYEFEFVIINDGSSDKTDEIVRSFYDNRIVYIANKNNEGIIRSLNKGIYFSKGQFLGRMDCDDVSRTDRFELQIEFLNQNPELSIVGSDYEILPRSDNNNIIPQKRINVPTCHEDLSLVFLHHNAICHPTVVMRKENLNFNKLYYDRLANHAEDYKLWVDATLSGLKFGSIPSPLLKYRLHSDQISTKKREEQFNSACKIMLGYATTIFSQSVINNPRDYLGLILNTESRFLKDQDFIKYTQLAKKLITENNRQNYFNKEKFDFFMENKLNNLNPI
ncbi:glycosyltransferase [Sphingobacterium ginsenosidimutans]